MQLMLYYVTSYHIQGRIFLDADPVCFGRLLSMLRLKAISIIT